MKNFKLYFEVTSKLIRRYGKKVGNSLKPRYELSKPRSQNLLLHFFKTHQRLIIFLGSLLVVWLISGILIQDRGILFQNHFSEGMIGLYNQDNLPPQVLSLISKPLVRLDSSANPQPELAESWTVNNDATVYTFKLRSNLIWSDMTKLVASDINLTIIGGRISYPDELTIQIELNEPFAMLPSILTHPVLKKGTLIGLGPYQTIRIAQNRTIFSAIELGPIEPSLAIPKITIQFYPDEKTAKTAYQLGKVDSLVGNLDDLDFKNQGHTKLKNLTSYDRVAAVFYNTKDPNLSDKNLRKALNSATPIIEGEKRALSPIYAGSWAYNSLLKESLNDLAQAKVHLAKLEKPGVPQIILTTTPALLAQADLIVKAWNQMGVKAVVRVESGVPQNFQALLMAQPIPLHPDQYILWHSTQTQTNISKLDSKRVDRDLEDGRRSTDQNIRKERYLDLQRIIVTDEVPATFLYFPKFNFIYRKRVEDSINKILSIQFPNL